MNARETFEAAGHEQPDPNSYTTAELVGWLYSGASSDAQSIAAIEMLATAGAWLDRVDWRHRCVTIVAGAAGGRMAFMDLAAWREGLAERPAYLAAVETLEARALRLRAAAGADPTAPGHVQALAELTNETFRVNAMPRGLACSRSALAMAMIAMWLIADPYRLVCLDMPHTRAVLNAFATVCGFPLSSLTFDLGPLAGLLSAAERMAEPGASSSDGAGEGAEVG